MSKGCDCLDSFKICLMLYVQLEKSLFSQESFVSHNTCKVLRSCGLQAQEEEKEEDKSFYC